MTIEIECRPSRYQENITTEMNNEGCEEEEKRTQECEHDYIQERIRTQSTREDYKSQS